MRERIPTVISLAALAVALLGWTSLGHAAGSLVLPAHSVGTAQLQDGAVTAAKVRKHALLASNFRPGQLPRGPRGAQGAPGAPGAPGPSDAYSAFAAGPSAVAVGTSPARVVELQIPQAGDYVIGATGYFVSGGSGIPSVTCTLDTLGGDADTAQFLVSNPTPVAFSVTHEYPGAGVVDLDCATRAPVDARSVRITAVRVGTLESTDAG